MDKYELLHECYKNMILGLLVEDNRQEHNILKVIRELLRFLEDIAKTDAQAYEYIMVEYKIHTMMIDLEDCGGNYNE